MNGLARGLLIQSQKISPMDNVGDLDWIEVDFELDQSGWNLKGFFDDSILSCDFDYCSLYGHHHFQFMVLIFHIELYFQSEIIGRDQLHSIQTIIGLELVQMSV